MKSEVIPIEDLVPDPANVRRRDDDARQTLANSVRAFGAARSIVVDGKGVVRAGNGTLEAAKAAGITKALVVEASGDELVVVRRKDWSPTEATAYAIADNRTSDKATNDDVALAEQLRALQSEDFDLGAVGYTDEEVDRLIEDMASALDAGEGEPDADGPAVATGQFGVIVICRDEPHQREVYERLTADGMECKVVCV